jgi:hypothetical protein
MDMAFGLVVEITTKTSKNKNINASKAGNQLGG